MSPVRHLFWLLTATVATLANSGCGSPKKDLPQTHAVTGEVISSDKKPFPGGMIEFKSAKHPQVAIGQISPVGEFELSTTVDNTRLDGAVEGEYQVTIMPDMAKGQSSASPIVLAKKYTVKAGDNRFTIIVPRVRK
jgi:hypothetical protein